MCHGGVKMRCPGGQTAAAGSSSCVEAIRSVWEDSCQCSGGAQVSMAPGGASCACLACDVTPGYAERQGGCSRLLRPFHVMLAETTVTHADLGNVEQGGGALYDALTAKDTVVEGTSPLTRTRLSSLSTGNNSLISCAVEDSKPSVNYFFPSPVDVFSAELFTPNVAVQQACTDVRAHRLDSRVVSGSAWDLTTAVEVSRLQNAMCGYTGYRAWGIAGNGEWTCSYANPDSCSGSKTFVAANSGITRYVNWLQFKTGKTTLGCVAANGGVSTGNVMFAWPKNDETKSIVGPNTKMALYNLGASWVDGLSFYGSCSRGGYDQSLVTSGVETCAPCPGGHFCPGGASVPINCSTIPCMVGMWLSGCNAMSSGVCEVKTQCSVFETEVAAPTPVSDRECGRCNTTVHHDCLEAPENTGL